MNNSLVALNNLDNEESVDTTPLLRNRESELNEVIAALRAIKESNYWKLLEERIWSKELSHLQKRLGVEKDPAEIYRLQGQIHRVEKYADLNTMVDVFKKQLQTITSRIQNNAKTRDEDIPSAED